MSPTQISPSRSFSPFWFTNKKASSAIKNFDLIARSFDENLLRRLEILFPGSNPPSISFSWLSLAVDLLSSTHAEARTLISGLNLSASDDSLARYLDESVKLLDVCNSISSEIERLRQRRLLLNFALHLIDFSGRDGEIPAPEKLRRARECLDDWEKNRRSGGFSKRLFEMTPDALIRDLAVDLCRSSRGKLSSVGKLVRRTFYAVGLVTVFVCGALVLALFGSEELVSVRAPTEFPWADSFNALESAVHGELKLRFGSRKAPAVDAVQEMVDVDSRVRSLRDVIETVEKGGGGGDSRSDALSNAVKEVGTAMEAFSEGLDGLCNGVNGLFQKVLCNRKGMLGCFVNVEKQQHQLKTMGEEVNVNSC